MILRIRDGGSNVILTEGSKSIQMKSNGKYLEANIEPQKEYCIYYTINNKIKFFLRSLLWCVFSLMDFISGGEEKLIDAFSLKISMNAKYKTYLYIYEEAESVELECVELSSYNFAYGFSNTNNANGYIRYENALSDEYIKRKFKKQIFSNFCDIVIYSIIAAILFKIGSSLEISYADAIVPFSLLIYINFIACTLKSCVDFYEDENLYQEISEKDYYSKSKTKWIRFRNKTNSPVIVSINEERGRIKKITVPENVSNEILVDENTDIFVFDSNEKIHVEPIKNKILYFWYIYMNRVFLNKEFFNLLGFKNYVYKNKKIKNVYNIAEIEKPVFIYSMDDETNERRWQCKTGEEPLEVEKEEVTEEYYCKWKKYVFGLYNVTNIIFLICIFLVRSLGETIISLFVILLVINIVSYILILNKAKS